MLYSIFKCRMSSPTPSVCLKKATGLPGRLNDLVVVEEGDHLPSVLVFFGGDVQDLLEVMEVHRDNKRYLAWSLESVARLLARAMPSHQVVVVRPSRRERATFSCYDNFVPTDSVGSPKHAPSCGAVTHLTALLREGLGGSSDRPVSLVGFSKGVVVLNQILREISVEEGLRIEKMVWLDGGHNGGKDIWPTDKKLLEVLVEKKISVDVRVSPYQVKNPLRPWLGREEKLFTGTLKRLGADITRKLYFEEEEPSIETHFRVIETLAIDPM